jgi:hypothetical protein
MANAIEKIKLGLCNQDLFEISEGYELLTGEKIEIKKNNEIVTKEQILSTIEFLYEVYKNYHGHILVPAIKELEKRKSKKEKSIPKPPPAPENETTTKGEPIPSQSNKTSIFGNKTNFITEEVSNEEIEKIRKKCKLKERRPPTEIFTRTCSSCNHTFKSYMPESDDIGQKCDNCIKDAIKNAK